MTAHEIVHDLEIGEISPEAQRLARRGLSLLQQFTQAMIADDDVGDEVPHGVTLVLIPDDDELAEVNLRSAVDAAHRGKNVYIRHMYRVGDKVNDRGDPVYSPYPLEKPDTTS